MFESAQYNLRLIGGDTMNMQFVVIAVGRIEYLPGRLFQPPRAARQNDEPETVVTVNVPFVSVTIAPSC
jgi:hypothetical protein